MAHDNKNGKQNGCIKKYRYLMTIARRICADSIIFRLIPSKGRRALEVKVPVEMEGGGVKDYIKRSVYSTCDYKIIKMGRHLGSKTAINDDGKSGYFIFSCDGSNKAGDAP